AISLTGQGRTFLISDLDLSGDRRLSYSVLPYLAWHGALEGLIFLPFGTHYSSEDVVIRDAILQVGPKRMFIYTGGSWLDTYSEQTNLTTADVLLIRQNPKKS